MAVSRRAGTYCTWSPPPSDDTPAPHSPQQNRTWAAYAACAWGIIFAAISIYWGLGGHLGLNTIGGTIEKRALRHDTDLLIAVWVTAALKLVSRQSRTRSHTDPRAERKAESSKRWLGSLLCYFISYGGVVELGNLVVITHLYTPSQTVEWTPLRWHVWLWDMSLILWGLLIIHALRQQRPHRVSRRRLISDDYPPG